jgi:hypothetical protein
LTVGKDSEAENNAIFDQLHEHKAEIEAVGHQNSVRTEMFP